MLFLDNLDIKNLYNMISVMKVQKTQEKSPTSVCMVLGLARQNKSAVFQFLGCMVL